MLSVRLLIYHLRVSDDFKVLPKSLGFAPGVIEPETAPEDPARLPGHCSRCNTRTAQRPPPAPHAAPDEIQSQNFSSRWLRDAPWLREARVHERRPCSPALRGPRPGWLSSLLNALLLGPKTPQKQRTRVLKQPRHGNIVQVPIGICVAKLHRQLPDNLPRRLSVNPLHQALTLS